MNFLAHIYLSGNDDEIIIGNFIADHVKGSGTKKFSDKIQAGIKLHREIDKFTDAHPEFLKSKKRLAETYRKYAGVVVDMYYDHFLSANWSDYSEEDLDTYTHRIFKIISKRYLILPFKTQQILPFMVKSNWLKAYGSFEGLNRALSGMARRTPFNSKMEHAVDDLKKDYSKYQDEFRVFFPQIIDFSEQKRKRI
jgi:acyl carrier protein phosphodiesterase